MRRLLLLLLMLLPLPASAQEAIAEFGTGPDRLVLRSTTDIDILGRLIERFVTENPDLSVTFEQWGSNALFERSRADCAAPEASADAVFSSAVQQMVWLVNARCARPYRSAGTEALPDARRWRHELWGVTTEPAVIVYNRSLLQPQDVPRDRFALLDLLRAQPERFRGKVATYDITASGLGYLFAHADSLEATTFGSLLEGFERIEAVATCCSAEIIEGVARGRYLLAYNVLGSYAGSVPLDGVGVVQPEDYTLILSRAYFIPRNAARPEASARLLDFLLSPEVQPLLRDVGLLAPDETEDGSGSASRRFIPLSPALLVALDGNLRTRLLARWSDAFRPPVLP